MRASGAGGRRISPEQPGLMLESSMRITKGPLVEAFGGKVRLPDCLELCTMPGRRAQGKI